MEEGSEWVCSVCGYVHRGSASPALCPICGAASSDFLAQAAPEPRHVAQAANRWCCLICSYVAEGDAPPACPVCGAGRDEFTQVIESAPHATVANNGLRRILIVGGGIAAVSAAESARETSPNAEIVVVSQEASLPYYRLNLTRYLAGEVHAGELPIHPSSWYAEHSIRLVLDSEVTAVNPEARTITLASGTTETYDSLVLACGAHAFLPPIPGSDSTRVTTFRTVTDAGRLLEAARRGDACVCVGGGILGLETAGALARRGVPVTLLESYGWLLSRQLNRDASRVLLRLVTRQGLEVRTGVQVTEMADGGKNVKLSLNDGSSLSPGMAIVTAGVRPNSHLARRAGLLVDQGVLVDSYLRSSCSGIFAAGDVAQHQGVVYGLWEPARYQGVIAGMNAAGACVEFGGLPRANTLKVLGIPMFSAGTVEPQDGACRVIEAESDGTYARYLFRDSHLVGAVLVGDTRASAAAMQAIKDRQDCSGMLRPALTVSNVTETLLEELEA